jgi:subtilisin-like proprotein convertase family protein
VPSDPLHDGQWHLASAIAGVGIEAVWDDYAGRGVLVGVIDDGFEHAHGELRGTYRADLDHDTVEQDGDAAPSSASDNHGTGVAGVIGAEAGNGYGGSGIAWAADLVGYRISFGRRESSAEIGDALARIAAVDVANNSWGYGGFFGDNFASASFALHGQAIEDAVRHGRDGLGTVLVFAAGNGRAQGQDVNYHDFQNSPHAITVAATDRSGAIAPFSTPGAAVLVAAPGDGILTTDRTGAAGYAPGDFASLSGTSFAAPIVSGVIALVLEANRGLGYRDVQEILAYSARKTSAFATGARTNGAADWNGGGLTYNHDFGFGLVDARAAVRLAETWEAQSTFAGAARLSASAAPGLAIPDLGTAIHAINIGGGENLEIDRVEVAVDIDHGWIGDLVLTLVSPSGTESVLVNRPGVSATSTYGIGATSLRFTMNSVHFWGERPEGAWTLRVQDAGGAFAGTLRSWRLDFIGDASSADDVYVYTDAFASLGTAAARTVVRDTDGGTDALNFAAVHAAVSVDLTPGAASNVLGHALAIDAETVIENVEGGDGSDWIAGNAAPNRLRGWRGDDSLAGGAGDDLLDGGEGLDTAVFIGPLSAYDAERRSASGLVLRGPEGTDLLLGVERLRFSDGAALLGEWDPLLDPLFYLGANRDVYAAGADPRTHYAAFGWHEGRDPSAFFDSSAYLAANPDVAAADVDPLEHYRAFGWREGRDPSQRFDIERYLARNPDVAAAGIDPLGHYLEFGRTEGRATHLAIGRSAADGIDRQFYLAANPDVATVGIDPALHFRIFGWREGRDPNALFDTSDYLTANPDVMAADIDPLQHYISFGWREGRQPGPGFDATTYLATYADVAAASTNPLLHYLTFGHAEGRLTFGDSVWLSL